MEEKKLFIEIPGGKNNFHSAILTTFSIDFHHFESQVLRSLKQKWITNIVALVDQRILDDVLGAASGNLKQLSQSYSLVGIKSVGAFHPKLNFFVGDDKLLAVFGSGNLTPGGHGKNHELFTGFYADKDNRDQLPLLLEAWDYIKMISGEVEGYTSNCLLQVIPKNCTLLNGSIIKKNSFHKLIDSISIALLYNHKSSIYNQLVSLIPRSEITKITIISPYYDEDGATLNNLLEYFSYASIEAYVPVSDGLPPVKIKKNKRIVFFSWEETERGKKKISGKNTFERKLHSKIFHFQSADFEYCLIGSANATIHGVGGPENKPINQEFCALYKSSKKGILKFLGITGTKTKISIEKYIRPNGLLGDNPLKNGKKLFHVTCADLTGTNLKVYIKAKENTDNLFISIFDGNGVKICSQKSGLFKDNFLLVNLGAEHLKLNPVFLTIEDKNEDCLSNKQLINYLDKLWNTDPSKKNRGFIQYLNSMEAGVLNEFDIIDIINQIEETGKEKRGNSLIQRRCKPGESDEDVSPVEMTYEEAVAVANDPKNNDRIIKTHFSTRLWESVSHLFQDSRTSIDEELMDEEELGNASEGRDRKAAEPDIRKVIIKNISQSERILNSTDKMASNYINVLAKFAIGRNHVMDIIDLSHFLLITHMLTVVHCFTDYELKDNLAASKWKKILGDCYMNFMVNILENFTKTLMRNQLMLRKMDPYLDEKLKSHTRNTLYHSLMYLYLLNRRCSISFINDKLELIGLNLLSHLGKPDSEFDTYISDLSKSFMEMYFNADSVIKFKNRLIDTFDNPSHKNKYIYFKQTGFCKILEKNGKEIVYRSLYGKGSGKMN